MERSELWAKYLVHHSIGYYKLQSTIFEDIGANSEWELLPECDYLFFGALTSAPILAFGVQRNDQGDVVEDSDYTKLWWFQEYETRDDLEELLRIGEVIYQKG